jgi:hypothetical protein
MSLNVAMQVYRGPKANIANLATTGNPGVLAWTNDSYELYVDKGTGSAGIGAGNAWQKISNDISVFTAASQAAQTSLTNVQVGDLCTRTDQNLTYLCTGYPSSTFTNWTPIAITSGTAIQGLAGPVANEWVSYIDTAGVQHLAQPSFANISGQLSQTQLPTTIGAGSSLTTFDCGTF